VKISKLTNALLVSLLLPVSVVEADSKYPATDFQPKVVYQDSNYKHAESSSSSSASKAEVSVADPNYPAANFQPEVLYQDKGYQHKKDTVSRASKASQSVSYQEEAAVSSEEASDSSLGLVVGLGILACIGFVLYSKNNKPALAAKTVARRSAVSNSASSAQSSVDKYLATKIVTQPSGVEKYLEERNASVSGVAKYVAKKKVSARLASVTGVEKYLKERG